MDGLTQCARIPQEGLGGRHVRTAQFVGNQPGSQLLGGADPFHGVGAPFPERGDKAEREDLVAEPETLRAAPPGGRGGCPSSASPEPMDKANASLTSSDP